MDRRPQLTGMTADELRAILDAAGANQETAAVLLGVNQTTVSRWLNDLVAISEEKAALIRARITPP
jgi:DNA-binding transcriptional regulator YdaS (Cro superfamily)